VILFGVDSNPANTTGGRDRGVSQMMENLRAAGATIVLIPEQTEDPDTLLAAVQNLGANVDDCVYVCDTVDAIMAARIAGMASAVVIGGTDCVDVMALQPDVQASTLTGLLDELLVGDCLVRLSDTEFTLLLQGFEAVRKRPKMYIGSTDIDGIVNMVSLILDCSYDRDDEYGGWATVASVTILKDGGIRVSDDGRGLPVFPTQRGALTVRHLLTRMSADGRGYNPLANLYAINALSSHMVVTVNRDGRIWRQDFTADLHWTQPKDLGPSESTGMSMEFWPLPEIFGRIDPSELLKVLTPLTEKYPNLTILIDATVLA